MTAFACFPHLEYCVITVPHTSHETPLLSLFSRAEPRSSSTFPQALYVLHRAALLGPKELIVRRAQPSDIGDIAAMTAKSDSTNLLELVGAAQAHRLTQLAANPPSAAFVCECQSQVVGVLVLSSQGCQKPQLTALSHAYDFRGIVNTDLYHSSHVAMLEGFLVSPLFARHTRYMLRQAMQQYGKKSWLLYRVSAEEAPLPCVDELVQVPPRELHQLRPSEAPLGSAADGTDPRLLSHSLFTTTRRLLSEPKVAVNARIVVVGNSDAALGFLSSLLLTPYLLFTNVTVVAEGGLPSPANVQLRNQFLPTSEFSPTALARLGLQLSTRVVDDSVVAMDREQSVLVLSDDSLVPYDFAVLAPDVSETTVRVLRAVRVH